MSVNLIIFVLLKSLAFILGCYLTGLTYLTYKEKHDTFLFILSVGFLWITISIVIEDIMLSLTDLSISTVHLFEAIALFIGFGSIGFALFRSEST